MKIGRRGFTLLEVILAVVLLAVLAGGVMAFLWNLGDRRRTLLGAVGDHHAAAVLLDRIEADLLAVVAGDEGDGEGAGEAGVRGTRDSLRLLTRGVWIGDGSGDANALREAGARDMQGAEYRFERASRRVTARRWEAGNGRESAGEAEVVSDRVERVRLRYFDGREWLEEFDSLRAGGLPVAVEVAVWILPPGAIAPLDAAEEEGLGDERNWREPDRLRVIVALDGPVTAWREGR